MKEKTTCLRCWHIWDYEDDACPECGSTNTSDGELKQCPECMEGKIPHELDMFGGLCEDCNEELNQEK